MIPHASQSGHSCVGFDIRTILRYPESMPEQICPECQNTVVDPTCKVCGGKGKITLDVPPDPTTGDIPPDDE
jgi:hypothetical protein